MKVLMTADTVGGVWLYALELARALGEWDVHVSLATMGAPLREEQWQDAARIPNLEVRESAYRLEWMEDPWSDVDAAGEWLLDLKCEVEPHVVHLNGYAHGALPWGVPTLMVGHSCVLSWWAAVRGGEAPPAEWGEYRRRVADGLRAVGRVVAPTKAMLNELRRYYGLAGGSVIPNGRDPNLFTPGPKGKFVLAVGRVWDEAKGISTLSEVAPALEWPVCIAGANRHPDGGVASLENGRLLGVLPQGELAQHYAAAPIYALPARYEPFGLSALEAALSGCALVLGDIPSLREVWGDAALFVPPSDGDAWRHTLNRLIGDERERQDLGRRARLHTLQYTPRRMALGYIKVYRSLIAGEKSIQSAKGDLAAVGQA